MQLGIVYGPQVPPTGSVTCYKDLAQVPDGGGNLVLWLSDESDSASEFDCKSAETDIQQLQGSTFEVPLKNLRF